MTDIVYAGTDRFVGCYTNEISRDSLTGGKGPIFATGSDIFISSGIELRIWPDNSARRRLSIRHNGSGKISSGSKKRSLTVGGQQQHDYSMP